MQQNNSSGRLSAPAVLDLWRRYRLEGEAGARDRLVLSLAPIVKSIVFRKAREIPAHRELEDFISCGLEALIRAVDRYDPDKGATLEQYAWTRVHGAVLDELRADDWAPRSLRRLERELRSAREAFTVLHGREPTRSELADALAITEAELDGHLADLSQCEVASLNAVVVTEEGDSSEWLDTLVSSDPAVDPVLRTLRAGETERFRAAFARLETREQYVAVLLYVHELTLREIGEVLGISESRVCQLHRRLKVSLHRLLAGDEPAVLELV